MHYRKNLKRWPQIFLIGILSISPTCFVVAKEQAIEKTEYLRKAHSVLDQIQLVKTSIEPLASEKLGNRFAIHYRLQFPEKGEYATFPATLLLDKPHFFSKEHRYVGHYFLKAHPEYHKTNFVFEPRAYDFSVVFDLGSDDFNPSQATANLYICYGAVFQRGFPPCRTITIKLGDFPHALATQPPPTLREPAVAKDNFWDIQEKSIRIADLQLFRTQNKTGLPVEFSFVITNIGKNDIKIPEKSLSSLIHINYGWEAISAEAKKTKPHAMRLGNAIAAGGTQFNYTKDGKTHLIPEGKMAPSQKILIKDKIDLPGPPFGDPFMPGEYKLHIFLYNNYSTGQDPVQELIQHFTITP